LWTPISAELHASDTEGPRPQVRSSVLSQ
jgi:hypothetical protein